MPPSIANLHSSSQPAPLRRPVFRFPHPVVFLLAPLVLALPGCREDAESPTAPAPSPAIAATTVAPSFLQVSAGGSHTCGLTADGHAYCWGFNGFGELGDGTTADHTTPVAVAGGRQFFEVRAGDNHTCGVTTDNRAYCWGNNDAGQLGDGTTIPRAKPVAVAGGRHFTRVRPGYRHTCGVTPSSIAFCWGYNLSGQLGDGTTTDRLVPVPVAGGRLFQLVAAGGLHTCGLTTGNQAYCWGRNANGELGDGTVSQRLRPVAVAGGLSFQQVVAGVGRPILEAHSCGVTTDRRAYCWGRNRLGQLGDATIFTRLKPVAVKGGLRFTGISLGSRHTCGVTTASAADCWGSNVYGQLGDGTTTRRLTPVAVSGGLQFPSRGVSAGGGSIHTCGVTKGGKAYCWGSNFAGQLGDGTTTDRLTPVPVQ